MALVLSEKALKAEREKIHKDIETMEAFEEHRKYMYLPGCVHFGY